MHHDNLPVNIKNVVKGTETHYFNAYPIVEANDNRWKFNNKDSEAVRLADLDEGNVVRSLDKSNTPVML